MMTAAEAKDIAKRIRDENVKNPLIQVLELIRQNAEKGYDTLQICDYVETGVREELIALGYSVSVDVFREEVSTLTRW